MVRRRRGSPSADKPRFAQALLAVGRATGVCRRCGYRQGQVCAESSLPQRLIATSCRRGGGWRSSRSAQPGRGHGGRHGVADAPDAHAAHHPGQLDQLRRVPRRAPPRALSRAHAASAAASAAAAAAAAATAAATRPDVDRVGDGLQGWARARDGASRAQRLRAAAGDDAVGAARRRRSEDQGR